MITMKRVNKKKKVLKNIKWNNKNTRRCMKNTNPYFKNWTKWRMRLNLSDLFELLNQS